MSEKIDDIKYIIRHVDKSGEFFYPIPPGTMKEIQEYVKRAQIGGEICACVVEPLARIQVTFPTEEILAYLEKTDNRTNTSKSEVAEQVPQNGKVRGGANSKPGNPTGDRKRGSSVPVSDAAKVLS